MDWSLVLENAFIGIKPMLPLLIGVLVAAIVLLAPLPGRGPGFRQRRDPWRLYKFAARRQVFERAGGRCESGVLLFLGRCGREATEADHVYPWSKCGATIASNAQALCRQHNRSKANRRPPWWYVVALERRRRGYFPQGQDVRVSAAMTDADRLARTASRRPSRADT